MAAKHSPAPWRVSSDEPHVVEAFDPRGDVVWTVAVCHGEAGNDITDNGESNAAFIVRAVNAHDEMLADLRRDLQFARSIVAYLKATGSTKDVVFSSAEMTITRLCYAIAKAEGRY